MANRSLFQVTLVVDDYDRAKAYYCGVLGFDCVEDKPQGEGKRWVVLKPGKDGAALVLAKASTDMQKSAIGKQTGGRVGFFLSTDDFARDHQSFLECHMGSLLYLKMHMETRGTLSSLQRVAHDIGTTGKLRKR
ncbi:hypothetical protein F5B22DRAFT_577542 [Xylaria bambusicola]|uniref:uncharacterized protein n=1 Tax=Xylaria bambusicola TaxID=326684 RepID=UPI002007A603|nr:uncharacterized protein F5B22DRAFT_577542 [Xylaria bambusicola]KAI0503001.1 hypothetical protein F5B22DRAFT_577542 [Xylaria bambusicola]